MDSSIHPSMDLFAHGWFFSLVDGSVRPWELSWQQRRLMLVLSMKYALGRASIRRSINLAVRRRVNGSGCDAAMLTLISFMGLRDFGYGQIVTIGDSLTEYGASKPGGWGHLLASHYSRKLDVVARGFASYTTYWLKFAIPALLHDTPPYKIKLFTLLLGTNDYVQPTSNKHVPLEKYVRNMEEIIRFLLSFAPGAKILVLAPPPMAVKIIQDPNDGSIYATLDDARAYRDACIALISQLQLENANILARMQVLNTWDLFASRKQYDDPNFDPARIVGKYFSDPRHFNGLGNCVLFEGVIEIVDASWPELKAINLPHVLPADYENGPSVELDNDDK
ncbi:hypothetical protein HK100_002239, partial [Physocladia obscura]